VAAGAMADAGIRLALSGAKIGESTMNIGSRSIPGAA